MDKVKAKGGAMFAAAQQQDNPEGLEFTGLYVRSVAERLAVEQAAAVKTSETNAALRRVAATTTAGRHGRARVAWKAVCAEQVEGHTHTRWPQKTPRSGSCKPPMPQKTPRSQL
jgi:hypothetical protein